MKKTKDALNSNFKLLMPFHVKESSVTEEDLEVIKIEGYGNFAGLPDDEDDCSNCYIDRANEIVLPSGMDISNYKKNPVILFQHDRDDVIGKATSVTKKADGIYIKAEIHAGACDPEVFYAIKNGLLQSFSIGFRTKQGSYREIGKNSVYVIEKSELFECSCVTIPCNAASTFSVTKSFDGDEGFYAGELNYAPDQPAEGKHITAENEDTMKLKLRDILPEDQVKSMEALGLTTQLDALQDVDMKLYIDGLVAKEIEKLRDEFTEKLDSLKTETKAEEETEEEKPASEEEPPAEEEEGKSIQDETVELKEEEVASFKALRDEIAKLTASAEEK